VATSSGGFTAAMLSIPVSMGYGLLAFAALGEAYIPQAILAGLYAPVWRLHRRLLLGANTTMIYSPRSIVTFLIGSSCCTALHGRISRSCRPLRRRPCSFSLCCSYFWPVFFQTSVRPVQVRHLRQLYSRAG
jgi:hypothetical protein